MRRDSAGDPGLSRDAIRWNKARQTIMTIRTRKFAGTVALMVFLAVYAFLAMLAAVALQVSDSKLLEIGYYAIAGLAWVPAAAWVVSWMLKPDPPVE
jgi:hypothetical protein